MKLSSVIKVISLFLILFVFLASVSLFFYLRRVGGIEGIKRVINSYNVSRVDQKILNEESVVVDIAEKSSPSVVTISITTPRRRILEFNPFGGGLNQRLEGGNPQDIGTGFIVSSDGLIITNKHVVDNSGAKYKVITKDDKEYEVLSISKDPSNDLAILKIDAKNLTPLELGTSKNLKVGQFVVAIGTALGEFRHTVTTGVISGLGRGINAGDPFQGFVERLDDVIQTDAAINPGNSGGPLLNSLGQVIGVNVAVAQGAQNIGFAIPIDTVKVALDQYKQNGSFASKAFLGVSYQMVGRRAAILNEVPEGAYVEEVLSGSPAEKAGIKAEDIIIEIDGRKLSEVQDGLAGVIKTKKPGQNVTLKYWRNGEQFETSASLSSSEE